jgi:hypothetical protein
MFTFVRSLFVTSLAVALLGPIAGAEVSLGRPGSVLVFPLFDSTSTGNTIITVTNTNNDHTFCDGSTVRVGDIDVVYYYIDGDTWECTDITERFTPNDTLSVLTNVHNPNMARGFLVVQARDVETFRPVDFDFLIGSAIIVNTDFDFSWSYLPYSFEAQFVDTGSRTDRCGRRTIEDDGCVRFGDPDDDDHDGNTTGKGLTFYDRFPDVLLLDHFFGEGTAAGAPGTTFSNRLVLLSTNPSFQEDDDDSTITRVSLLGWNNNERRFSRTFQFSCWFESTLADITGAATQRSLAVDGNPDELAGVATGWLKLKADEDDIGILGVFLDTSTRGGTTFTAGNSLQFDFLEDRGDRGKDVKICCGSPF